MKGRRAVLILKVLMLCTGLAIVVAGSAQGAGTLALLDVPTPSVVEEPSHTVGTSNVVFWTPVVHTDLTAYRVQVSLASSFDSIWLSRVVGAGWDSTTFTGLDAVTYWYRVQAAYTPAADTFWSEWSAPTFSIQDVDPPNTDCDLDPAGEWSTLDSFTFSYLVEDPAGIDSVSLYRRIGDSDPWTMFDSLKPADSPMVVVGVIKFSSANDLEGDAHYQFFIGGRDNAKADNWDTIDTRSVGNVIKPTAGSPAMCEIKVDTRLPLSEIDSSFENDSLHTSLEFDIPYWARDTNTATGFVSGLDTVYLYWGVDSGTVDSTVSVENIPFNEVVLTTPDGDSVVNGEFQFEAPFDSSIYYFYTIAVDVAGNRQVDDTIYSTRVFTTLEATLTLFDTEDTIDSEYTGLCVVKAVIDFNVPAVDSLMLCEDSLFTHQCPVKNSQSTRPYTTEWLFSDCSDGEKFLYGIVWVGGKPDTISASIVLDTTPPDLVELYLFDLSSLDQGFTDDRLVGVDYRAVELPFNELQYLILSEDVGFAMPDTIAEYPAPTERSFLLSPDFERKTVYGYLVDRAENVSEDTLSASIMLFEYTHNYPNPFNPDNEVTNLVFTLAKNEKVTILIYDLFGNLVFEKEAAGAEGLNDGANDAALQWDGRNMLGVAVAGGGYICVIKAGDREISKHKIAVIR